MKIAGVFALVLWLGVPAWAQSGAQIKMDLQQLEDSADKVVIVNLEGKSLEGGKILLLKKGVTEPVKKLLSGLKGIYVRRFWFRRGRSYKSEDVEPIHEQMTKPGWTALVNVKDRGKSQTVSVYSYVENEEVAGVTVVSEDKQEVTVVNIVGPVDIETLLLLGEGIGIPAMTLATIELIPKKKPSPAPPGPEAK